LRERSLRGRHARGVLDLGARNFQHNARRVEFSVSAVGVFLTTEARRHGENRVRGKLLAVRKRDLST